MLYKYVLAVFTMACSTQFVMGQTMQNAVKYDYDLAGNRIKRSIIVEAVRGGEGRRLEAPQDTVLANTEVYPNPTFGLIHVNLKSWNETNKCVLIIKDMIGNIIFTTQPLNSQLDVDLGNYPNGTYLLHVAINENKKIWKIIKE